MSGDIDIEEHDLMENPKIRSIFPDLTLLKKEILDQEESIQLGNFTIHKNVDKPRQINNSRSSYKMQNAGSDSIINVKHEIEPEEISTNNQLDLTLSHYENYRNVPISCNKIILGSKPCGSSDKKLEYEVKIFLKDINKYLMKCERYCEVCQILFPKSHMLEQHKAENHKLGKTDKRNVNQSEGKVNVSNNYSINQCFHCKVIYSSQESLIEHLYEVLEKKRASISKTVLDNDQKGPESSSANKNISKLDCQKKCIEEECETLSDDTDCQNTSVDGRQCETLLLDPRDCGTISEDASCDKISINNENIEQIKLNEIEILCEISHDELFQCEICSYYFYKLKFYSSHMIKKHNAKVQQKNVVKFNPKCNFCSALHTGVKQYNAHLHKKHSKMLYKSKSDDNDSFSQTRLHSRKECEVENKLKNIASRKQISINKETNNDLLTASNMIFKTVLFKCLKCDVHFLSPNLAAYHLVHNEMLINWKCSICKIFFKKNDEEIHSKQHLYTNSFKIFNLDATDLSRILIKCLKCDIYIPNNSFTKHSMVCETNIQTWFCSVCDIRIYFDDRRTHKNFHSDRNNKKADFIVINDSVINKTICVTSSDNHSEDIDISEVEMSSTTSESDKTDSVGNDELDLSYPITNIKIKENTTTHIKLKRKKDYTPNSVSIKKIKRSKLHDTTTSKNTFYSKLNYKTQIQPKLILNLTYCQYCECFVSMYYKLDIHIERRCINILKRVCNFCGLTLTAKAITGHKEFHKINPGLKLQDFTFYDIKTSKAILPPIPKYPKCEICDVHFMNKIKIIGHVCNEKQYLLCDICDKKFCDESFNLHIAFHGYYLTSETSIIEEVKEINNSVEEQVKLDCPENREEGSLDEKQNEMSTDDLEQKNTDTNKYEEEQHSTTVIFMCENCSVAVNKYDQLIEHCHSHFDKSYKNITTKECSLCNLLFEESAITYHNQLHKNGVPKESFKIFSFDIFNFGCNNSEWLHHVFKSLSDNEIDEIIKDSIYRLEYRIKLVISQQGSGEYTLYRCSKCGITVDSKDIYNHRKICRGVGKKFPCEYCGIALISTSHRFEHMKIHKHCTISIKSYRIVVFNRLKDKTLNHAMTIKNNHYALYQCRICNGIVDWRLLKTHKCNVDDLKKCHHCGLLICSNDYDKHSTRHKLSSTFIASNMKVVRFGQSTMENNERNDRGSSFNGLVYDYTYYKCVKCDVCIQHLRPSSRHYCLINAAKWSCSICDLTFDEGKKKGHRSIHNTDTDFSKDTICVIPFDPQETYERLEKELRTRKTLGKDSEEVVDNVKEKTDVMYKCGLVNSCGLHFLTEESAKNHTANNKCGLYLKKHIKQTCSKCSLVFTSDVLFKHLIKHHGDKNVKYTFDIIDIKEDPENR